LAAATAYEAPALGLRAGAVTVDHGLQPLSAERADETAATLRSIGLDPVAVVRAEVGTAGGPEAAARKARYAVLDAATEREGASCVLLAHSRDDQAETVLLGLARGSGARSLSGMAPVAGRYRRPLLALPRATLAAACADAGLAPWHDPHNVDPHYTRTRVRHRVLPMLDAELGPGVVAALARSADLLRDDADALDLWAQRVGATCENAPGELAVSVLTGQPAAVRRRVLRAAAISAGSPATDLSAAHVIEIDRLLTRWHGQGPLSLPGRVAAARVGATIVLRRLP